MIWFRLFKRERKGKGERERQTDRQTDRRRWRETNRQRHGDRHSQTEHTDSENPDVDAGRNN